MRLVTKIESQEVFEALILIAKNNKIDVCRTYQEEGEGWEKWPYFVFKKNQNSIVGSLRATEDDTPLSLEEMIIELYTKPITLQLTEQYTATVSRTGEEVVVGCQKIPFTKVLELAKIIENIK